METEKGIDCMIGQKQISMDELNLTCWAPSPLWKLWSSLGWWHCTTHFSKRIKLEFAFGLGEAIVIFHCKWRIDFLHGGSDEQGSSKLGLLAWMSCDNPFVIHQDADTSILLPYSSACPRFVQWDAATEILRANENY